MSYSHSLAGVGLSTLLAIGDGATTEVFTTVGELKTLNQTGRTVATEDVTNFQSTQREFIPTLLDEGTWDFTGNRVGTDSGQILMESAINAASGMKLHNFKITLPKTPVQTTSGDVFAFAALVQEISYQVSVEKAVTFSGKIKVSGAITVTPGT